MKHAGLRLVLLLFLIILMTACEGLPFDGALKGGTPTPGVVTPGAPDGVSPPASLPEATAAPISPLPAPVTTLRVWLPPEIGARTEAGSRELADQIRAFRSAHRNLEVVVEQKPAEGMGGILGYLRAGRSVAPSIMPDLIAVPTSVLAAADGRELVIPLDGLIDATQLSDIYPAAAAQVATDDRVYGLPFAAAGLTHLVYRPADMSDSVPMTWSAFISETNHTLVLPADSRDGALFGLQFYLAEGGALTNEAGQPDLQTEPLARALSQIALNRDNLLQSRQMKTLDEAWQYFQLGLSEFVWTRAEFLLAQAAADPEASGYSRIPGPSGPLTPLTTTWAWAITTGDPARQALAAELITTLTAPEALAGWSAAGQLLPARRGAMALLAEGNDYYGFADNELERAQVMPVSESSRLFSVMGDAVFQALTTDLSPVVIAEAAAASLRQ